MLSGRTFLILTYVMVLACSVFAPTTAVAQGDEYFITYDEGLVSFDFDQYPWGSLGGTFFAEGPVWNDDLTFPNGALNGAGGLMQFNAVNDTNNVIAMSAIINDDGTIDAAIVFVAYAGDPVPGIFGVELGDMKAGFVFLDDTTNLTFPEDDDFETWFDGIEAAGKYVGMAGSIVVTQVNAEKFVGTFSGRVINPDTLVMLDLDNGVFDVTNYFVAPTGPMTKLVSLQAQPNPFNPQTTIFLDMPQAGHAKVDIYNMRGQRVRQLAAGSFGEGNHSWVWDGKNDQGTRQAGGLYFARATGQGWSVNRKLVYVP